jgi:hypothetical protein
LSAPIGWENKVDHRLRALWARLTDNERRNQTIRVLVRFIGSVEQLKNTGLKVGSVAGDIATGSMTLDDLPHIAIAPAIAYMELAQPLAPD